MTQNPYFPTTHNLNQNITHLACGVVFIIGIGSSNRKLHERIIRFMVSMLKNMLKNKSEVIIG